MEYSRGVYNRMLHLDPFAPLDEATQGLSKTLHKEATNAFLHTTGNAPILGRVIQTSLYYEEYRISSITLHIHSQYAKESQYNE